MKNKIKNWKCHERVVCSMVKEILIGKVVFPQRIKGDIREEEEISGKSMPGEGNSVSKTLRLEYACCV